jgi:hypothetical protein
MERNTHLLAPSGAAGHAEAGRSGGMTIGGGPRGLEADVRVARVALRYDRPLIEAVPCGAQHGGVCAGPGPTGGADRARSHSSNNNCPSVHEAARAMCHEAPQ